MKKLMYSLGLLGLLATASSCTDDDAAAPAKPANGITYDGQSLAAKTGVLGDIGPIDIFNQDDEGEEEEWRKGEGQNTHYLKSFSITDATDENLEMSYLLMANLYSPGTSFTNGTFNWFDINTFDEGDVLNKPVYVVSLLFDGNGDGDVMDFMTGEDGIHLPTDGKVTVSGSGVNYTINFDLTFPGGKKLKGVYSGDFVPMEEEEGFALSPSMKSIKLNGLK